MKKTLIALVCILVISLIPKTYSEETDKQTYDNESWNKAIIEKGKEIAHFKDLSDPISAAMEKQIIVLTTMRAQTDQRLDQLRFDLVIGSGSPYEYRRVLREICHVALSFQRILDSDRKDVDTLNYYLEVIKEVKDSLSKLKEAKNIKPEIISSLDTMNNDLTVIQNKFIEYRDSLNAALATTGSYSGISFDDPTKFNEIVFNALKSFYMTPDFDFFSGATWKVSTYLQHDWMSRFYLKMAENFPDNQNETMVLCICLFFGAIAFLILNIFINKYLKVDRKRLQPFKRSLFWFILAISFIAYNYSVAFMPKNSIIISLAILFLARALMLLGWGLRIQKADDVDASSSPFAPLFLLYVFGVFLQVTDLYKIFISSFWIIGIVIYLFFARKQFKKNFFKFEKALVSLSMVLGIICLLMVPIGLVYLSILIMMGWFLVCLGIQFARYISYSFNGMVQYIGGNYVVLKILLIGLSVPVLWLFIMLLIFMWGVGQIFGSYFFASFINTDIKIYNYTLNFTNFAFAIYLFFVFKTITNVAKLTIKRLSETSKIEHGASSSIGVLINYGLWSVYIIVMLKLLGFNMTSLAVISGGLSVGIGFGMRDILNNFVSGIIILGSHSIRHGDVVEIDGLAGKVIEITIRSTVVQTWENAIVCIPNSTIISNKLINWTNQDLVVRKDISIGVAYGSDIEKVKSILLRIGNEAEYILSKPAPTVFLQDFADSAITMTLRVWLSNIAYATVALSSIRERIYSDFAKNSIEIPFPQMDVTLKGNESSVK